jgi:hypothetical protein
MDYNTVTAFAVIALPLFCQRFTHMATFAELLTDLRNKDQVYRLQCKITSLHAVQGRNDGERERSHVAINQTFTTTHSEGLTTGETTTPQVRKRGRKKNTTSMIQAYQFERLVVVEKKKKDEVVIPTGPIILEVGGQYGLFGKALRDAVVAKDKGKYWLPGMTLIQFHPVKPLDLKPDYVALAPNVRTSFDRRVEPRNSNKPGAPRPMVPVDHEYLVDPILLDMEMRVNAECPRSTEEIAALLHAMQAVPFGPAKRGKLDIVECKQQQ